MFNVGGERCSFLAGILILRPLKLAMKNLFLFLVLPALAFAALPPTQEEAQSKFDAAVGAADAVVAEAIWYDRAGEESLLPVWSASSEEEIRALSRYFRLVIPPPKKEVVDGQQVLVYEGFRCGCHGQFVVTLRKKGTVLLAFVVGHGEHIGSKDLCEGSAIKVEREKLAPFYARLIEAAKMKADQMPVPSDANSPVVHR
jgi:hypothetical protein